VPTQAVGLQIGSPQSIENNNLREGSRQHAFALLDQGEAMAEFILSDKMIILLTRVVNPVYKIRYSDF